ncbi:MAG TPA: hypothetical protein PKL83_00600 [bacterium]|nr:hypothetical protein [bacterium]
MNTPESNLWSELARQKANCSSAPAANLYLPLQERSSLAKKRPKRLDYVILEQRAKDAAGSSSPASDLWYVLKNPDRDTYCRLESSEYFLWEHMDGSHTIHDLVIAYYARYQLFAFDKVVNLVSSLSRHHMLAKPHQSIFEQLDAAGAQKSPLYRLYHFFHNIYFRSRELAGLDAFFTKLYRILGKWLYSSGMQAVCLATVVTGTLLYAWNFFIDHSYTADPGTSAFRLLNPLTFLLVNIISLLLHELGHGLTVKHFNRTIERGGFFLHYGIPTLYVDTSDMWLSPKKQRLAVTWAGLYVNLIIASLATLWMFILPSATELAHMLYQIAFINYLIVFFNLTPFGEFDGYFLLIDVLEIPLLRKKSWHFWSQGLRNVLHHTSVLLPHRIVRRVLKLPLEKKIYLGYGLFSCTWTIFAIVSGLLIWERYVITAVSYLFTSSNLVTQIAIGCLLTFLLIPVLVGMILSIGESVRRWYRKRLS